MSNLAEYGGFGECQDCTALSVDASVPALVGGGSAAIVSAGVRGFAQPGTWPSQHAGVIGAVIGTMVALLAEKGAVGVASALLVGLSVEAVEYVTTLRLTAGA